MIQFRLVVLLLLFPLFCTVGNRAALAAGEKTNSFDKKKNLALGHILGEQLPILHYSAKPMDDERSEAIFTLYLKQLDYQKRFLLQSDVDQLGAFARGIDDGLLEKRIILPDAGADILGARIDEVEEFVDEMLADTTVIGLDKEDGSVEQAEKRGSHQYTVREGDTVEKIVADFPWVTPAILAEKNSDIDLNALKPGETLFIPSCPYSRPDKLLVGGFDMLKLDTVETDAKKDSYAADMAALKEKWRKIVKLQLISEYLDLEKERDEARKDGVPGEENIAEKNDIDLWQQTLAKILRRNHSLFHRLRQESLQDHYDRFFNAVARGFGPHTNYISPASKEQFDIHMRGSLEGIGAMLREEDGLIKVSSIVPGSASFKTGQLKAGDTILEVAQQGEEPVDITEMRLRDAVRLIRGPKGSTVILTVRKPDGSKKNIPIVRDVVELEETFVRSALLEPEKDKEKGLRVGYIYIPGFYRDFSKKKSDNKPLRNATDDTRKAVEELKEQFVDGMILDLRDDGGGSLSDAVNIAGLFIGSGPVVVVKNGFDDKVVLDNHGRARAYNGPLVVLVNKFSASASEIVAAALQDYGRAVIIGGEHTHGKGSVQQLIDLNRSRSFLSFGMGEDFGALKFTTQKFYRVTGGSTQYKGVEPDIVLPSLFAHIKSGERHLDYSLPWDTIAPIKITRWSTPLHLAEIKKRSGERIAADKDFSLIRKEAEKAVLRSEKSTVAVALPELRRDRMEAQLSEEKVGDLYKLHALSDEEAEKDGVELTKEEKKKKWLERVNKDPYVREGMNVIADLIGLMPGNSVGSN